MGLAAAYCAAFLKQTSWCNPQGYLDDPDFIVKLGRRSKTMAISFHQGTFQV